MEYRHLGRTGLRVSPLCLGTMNFGPQTSEPDSVALMDQALETGINFFDTANVYGQQVGEGATEKIIGRWLAQGDGRRERIVLATKVYGQMHAQQWPNFSMLSAKNIRQACEDSLRRLQTDHLDLYQMHHVDRQCPWDEIWQAMETLVRQGKVIYIGSSNFAGWNIATAMQTASRRRFMGLVSEQSIYHLDNRMVELEVLPACQHYGLGMIPWSPLGGGLLAGALQRYTEGRRSHKIFAQHVEQKRDRLERYEALCHDLGEQPADVALAWLLHNPVVTAPIIGPRTMSHLTSALRAIELELDHSTLRHLDKIFPGPGGEAPQAYAW